MAKKFGTGELISAGELQVDDVYVTNTKAKLRWQVLSIDTSAKDHMVVSSDRGVISYEFDRPLILVQRGGAPVPDIE